MRPDEEIINRWRVSAPFWEKHRDIIRGMFAPITQALIEDAGIGSQHSVLDVATGPGEPALSVAALAGPGGKVFGVDAIQGKVAAARGEAQRLGLQNQNLMWPLQTICRSQPTLSTRRSAALA
jgi:ubiquinone/menaquinone biosynthesis C-methylase UbiE